MNEQQVFKCEKCGSKFVISPLDVQITSVHFCPFCGTTHPKQVEPKDLTDARQLQLAVTGLQA